MSVKRVAESERSRRQVTVWGVATLAALSFLCAAGAVAHRATRQAFEVRLHRLVQRYDASPAKWRPTFEPSTGVVKTRQVTAAVIAKFIPYVREDLEHGELDRAERALVSLEAMMNRAGRAKQPEAKARLAFPTIGTARPEERRLKIEGRTITATGLVSTKDAPQDTPVFFNGFGSFQQVREDVELLPAVGANLIQIEIAPTQILPEPGVVDRRPLDELLRVLDRAAKAGVFVDVIVSPHYLPSWMFEKAPELRRRREGFVQYCIHQPAAREFLREYLRIVITAIKDHPALFSVCLANEPANLEEPCPVAEREWRLWLGSHHQGIDGYNRDHHTTLKNLEHVPLPSPFERPQDLAVWTDFIRFNQELHAAWLETLASTVHEIAPTLPVHVKALIPQMLGRLSSPAVGLDPTLLSRLGQLNGNDAYNFFTHGSTDFAQSWQENAMGYDLLSSLSATPIFNSENHLIPDREARAIPPIHLRTALWQAAVHGQTASVIWIWQRSFDHKSDYWGSILERPDAVEAVGLTNIDLNRAAREMHALQDAPADVTLLSAVASLSWDPNVPSTTEAVYTALSFTGLKIGFITERQLEAGILPRPPLILVPGVVHLSQRALLALSQFRGKIVFVGGEHLLSRDDHNRPAAVTISGELLTGEEGADSWRVIWPRLRAALPRWDLRPSVQIEDLRGEPLWGVEWRTAHDASGALIVNLCNYRHDAVKLRLRVDGRTAGATDVLSGSRVPTQVTLSSLETKLIRITN